MKPKTASLPPTKAFGYIRVSGLGQKDGDGPERQEIAIQDYARKHGMEVAGFYRDLGASGTVEDRPALARLMVDLEHNGHDVTTVIVERLDRLARDLMVQESIIRDFKLGGFKLISAVEGPDLLADDPTRKLIRQVLGAVAEYDRQMLVLKLRAARDRKREREGKCEGRKSALELRPEVLATIKRLRKTRPGFKRMSCAKAAEELNKLGYKTVSGKEWNGANVQNVCQRFPEKTK